MCNFWVLVHGTLLISHFHSASNFSGVVSIKVLNHFVPQGVIHNAFIALSDLKDYEES